jgi:hypothetical protein
MPDAKLRIVFDHALTPNERMILHMAIAGKNVSFATTADNEVTFEGSIHSLRKIKTRFAKAKAYTVDHAAEDAIFNQAEKEGDPFTVSAILGVNQLIRSITSLEIIDPSKKQKPRPQSAKANLNIIFKCQLDESQISILRTEALGLELEYHHRPGSQVYAFIGPTKELWQLHDRLWAQLATGEEDLPEKNEYQKGKPFLAGSKLVARKLIENIESMTILD